MDIPFISPYLVSSCRFVDVCRKRIPGVLRKVQAHNSVCKEWVVQGSGGEQGGRGEVRGRIVKQRKLPGLT